MFSRFRLSEEDANYFCFPWGKEKAPSPDICRIDRLPFEASCSPLVAIYALRRIMEDAGASDPIISAVRESMYVDDYLNSSSSVDAAVTPRTSFALAAAYIYATWKKGPRPLSSETVYSTPI